MSVTDRGGGADGRAPATGGRRAGPPAGAGARPDPAAPDPEAGADPEGSPDPEAGAGTPAGADPEAGAGTPAGSGTPRLRLPWALATAVVGGLLLTAAFPPVGVWPLAPVGPALLVLALWRRSLRSAFLIGLLFGLALFVPLLTWLVNLAWYVWIALAVAEALMFALLTIGQRVLLGLRAWPLAVAGWWVAAEAVRDRWPWGGFPWGRLAMSQAGTPAAPWTAIGGPPLLSFLIALAGTTLAWLVLAPAGRAAGRAAGGALRRRAVPAVCFALATGVTLAGALLPVDQVAPGTPTATVAAIQGNVPHTRNLPDLLRATTVTSNHAAATEQLAAQVRAGRRPAPDLVIWPENSTDLDPSLYPSVYDTIMSAVSAIDRPVLVGAVLQHPQRNAGQLWLPGRGPVAIYVKRQLVPFGEYIPYRSLLSRITPLVKLQPHNFVPGHKAVVFHIGRIHLGDVICYEVAFDSLVRSEVTAGANLLTMQTNDATFELDDQVGETLQQLAMARIRAVETDRAVVVASTTGVSAIIAPDGRLIRHSGTWQRAELEARVPLLTAFTPADRVGAWPEYVIVALTVAALAWAAAAAYRRRRAARGQADPAPPAGQPRHL